MKEQAHLPIFLLPSPFGTFCSKWSLLFMPYHFSQCTDCHTLSIDVVIALSNTIMHRIEQTQQSCVNKRDGPQDFFVSLFSSFLLHVPLLSIFFFMLRVALRPNSRLVFSLLFHPKFLFSPLPLLSKLLATMTTSTNTQQARAGPSTRGALFELARRERRR